MVFDFQWFTWGSMYGLFAYINWNMATFKGEIGGYKKIFLTRSIWVSDYIIEVVSLQTSLVCVRFSFSCFTCKHTNKKQKNKRTKHRKQNTKEKKPTNKSSKTTSLATLKFLLSLSLACHFTETERHRCHGVWRKNQGQPINHKDLLTRWNLRGTIFGRKESFSNHQFSEHML